MSLVLQTPYGTVRILEPKQILNEIRDLLLEQSKKQDARTIGLTGGSTPKKFYEEMATQRNRTDPSPWRKLHWSVSDERCVPIEDMESNFGNADRGFLQR